MNTLPRFQFIAHALKGDGPFRPTVTFDTNGNPVSASATYLVKYPRESKPKFARRCELAYYSSPLARVTSKFVSYIATKPVGRDIKNPLMQAVQDDVDGKGNNISVFFQDFMVEAKARGSMLLLVDMPSVIPENLSTQLAERKAPYWTPIAPELLVEYEIADDGKFDFAEFSGNYKDAEGKSQSGTWYFDRQKWQCKDKDGNVVVEGEHNLGECPLLISTESGDFPCFGSFAPIADLSKRLFNLDSELDEILRSQTFSLLTLEVPPDKTAAQTKEIAQTAGETIGTNNLMCHTGSTPAFIAPPDGPAQVYMERIKDIRAQISETGMEVATITQQESGLAMQLRFQSINAELARFSARMEDLERRAWAITAKWLAMTEEPSIAWPRDFNLADPAVELSLLRDMQETAMPQPVIIEQQKRIVKVQFDGADQETQDQLITSLNADKSQL